MNIKTILCPTDFSHYSQVANIYASLIADEVGAEIVFLHIVDPSAVSEFSADQQYSPIKKLRDSIRPIVARVRCRHEIGSGDPAQEILKVAAETNADLIVIGTHGRTGASQLLHGSVCAQVLRRATCPVMAVKPSINTKTAGTHRLAKQSRTK